MKQPAASADGPSQGAPLSRRRRLLVLAICCMSLLLVGLDNTIVNVALPSMGRDLNASASGLQWAVDAYSLVIAGLLMLAGSMGDRLGRRRVFRTGLILFTAGSLLCSLAPGLGWLIAFRAMQAVGGSMLNPVAMSIITNTFTDPRERAQAIGVWGGVIGVSMALGPVLGGVLVDAVGWRSIFWINVPVGLAALVLTGLFVPESKAARARRLDPVGQVLVMAALASLVYAIIEAPAAGWTAPETLALFGLCALAVAGLVGYESRRDEPLLDVRLFRSIPFSGATVIAVCAFAIMAGFLLLNTLYLQDVRGYSPMHAGLATLPMALMVLVFGPVSGRLVALFGPRPSLLVAGVALGASSAMMLSLQPDTSAVRLFTAYVLFGMGFGLVNAPITNTAVSGMPLDRAGVAAAVASTSRQVGSALGVAVIGSVAATHVTGALAAGGGESSHIDPTSAVGWWTMVGCGLGVTLLGLLTTGRWARATAERARARLVGGPAPSGGSAPSGEPALSSTAGPAGEDAAAGSDGPGEAGATAGVRSAEKGGR